MKHLHASYAATVIVCLVSYGCGGANNKPQTTPQPLPVTSTATRGAPKWIDNEPKLGAVGFANSNPLGDKGFQRTVAIADARKKLADKMQVRVQHIYRRLDQEMASGTAGKPKQKPVRSSVMQQMIDDTSREITDVELSGTGVSGIWNDENGDLWVLVEMDQEKYETDMHRAASKAIQGQIDAGEHQLDGAMDKLDAVIRDAE